MKKLVILLSLGFVISAHAKNVQTLDTIYANSTMNMALFFPSDIRQGITGSDNFVFTYNREKQQNLGLLKATKGVDSNLLVITTDGKVYTYIIRYAEHLEFSNRFINVLESIGNEKPTIPDKIVQKKLKKDTIVKNTTLNRLGKSCDALLKLPERKHIKKKIEGLSLTIKNFYYLNDKVFVQFEIDNDSEVDFDFDFLRLFRVSGNKKRKSSYQELPILPIYKHHVPNTLVHGTKVRFVYVLPKFVLDKNEKLLVKLKEQSTNRSVVLKWRI
ncbi:DUF4138 domain-containing protein [Flavivirga jejuensis]|uniref:DUF4138 domain-containing protein n=1 Tax=Flavivirga jejuensis TaxID=870487 RepID=A0ABT8WUU9_9FLAO|nr:DUF4138 domain-containing protein [Flavivirga jejuensis]MDO5976950.1 DUF4138 domain-containing protein [Flavivirga jejuensis]